MPIISKISPSGSVTIPFSIRKELGLVPGEKISFTRVNDTIVIKKVYDEALSNLYKES